MTRTNEPLETLSSVTELASGDFKLMKLFATHAWDPLTAMSTGRAKSEPGDQAPDAGGALTDARAAPSATPKESVATPVRREMSRTRQPSKLERRLFVAASLEAYAP